MIVLRIVLAALGCLVAAAALHSMILVAQRPGGYAIFSLLVGFGAAFFACAFLSPTRMARLAIPALTLLLPLWCFETLKNVDGPQRPGDKLDLVLELRREGKTAFPAVYPASYQFFPLSSDSGEIYPLSGIAHTKTVFCEEANGWMVYDSDHLGFNNPDNAWTQRQHIVVLGDSFVHGACLGGGRIFPDLLRKRYPGTINLGMADNGPLAMLAGLVEYLPLLNPGAVIWSYYEGNDLYHRSGRGEWRGDLARESSVPAMASYLAPDYKQHLAERSALLEELKWTRLEADMLSQGGKRAVVSFELSREIWDKLRRTLGLEKTLVLLGGLLRPNEAMKAANEIEDERLKRDVPVLSADMLLFQRILDRAGQLISARQARPIFLYLPSVEAYSRLKGHPLKSQVLNAARNAGFEIVDLEETMRASGRPFDYFAFGRRGGHFSPLGHVTTAGALLDILPPP
ncbi:exported hypothetical protein [Rhodospirillaceae bacterium LM-1]|nr:exported hypothetical protein [Rhodospirillaceae bacterium LM-1]